MPALFDCRDSCYTPAMCRGECPLDDICAQRLAVADAVLVAASQASSRQADDLNVRSQNGQGNDATLEQGLELFRETRLALQQSLGNVVLALQMGGETITQALEKFGCSGVVKKRQFIYFGKVTLRSCGSQTRTNRLKDHLMRRETPGDRVI